VLARFEELSEAVAAQYAQNLHDKVEQVGNHPVGPKDDSARPKMCPEQIESTGRRQEHVVVDVVSTLGEQKEDISPFQCPNLVLLDGTQHPQGCKQDLMLVEDHLGAAPGKHENGIDHVVNSCKFHLMNIVRI
jgi:hypothetical protein